MKRFYEANASETPPKPPLNPSYGYPQNGNRSLNQKPTKLGAYWFHMITEEFMAVIEGAGLEPDENNLHQLADIFQDFRDRATASEEFKVAAEAAAKRSEEAAKGVVTETASKIKEIQAEGKKQVDAVAQQGTAIQGQVDSAIDSIMAKATEVNAEVQAVGGQEQSALRTACQQQIEEIKRLFPTYVSDLNQSMVKTDAQSLSNEQKEQARKNISALGKEEAAQTYATKTELTSGLETKQPTGDYATRTELNNGLNGKANSSHSHNYVPTSGGTVNGSLTVTGTLKGYTVQATSDRRLKTNISELESLNIASVKAYRYVLKSDGMHHVGLIAQDLIKVLPEAVQADEKGFLSIDYNAVVALLVNKVQSLEARVSKLEGK